MVDLVTRPLTLADATAIAVWRYAPPYSRYDIGAGHEAYMADPANNFVVIEATGAEFEGPLAFASLGHDGQVPGFGYDENALDFGFALNPSVVGRGLGEPALRCALLSYVATVGPTHLRATVWRGNGAMQRIVSRLGFTTVAEFVATNGDTYDVWVAPANLLSETRV